MSYQFTDNEYKQGELHIPEGVRDVYAESCSKKIKLQETIRHMFNLYGFKDIETPTFEFFEVFGEERGTVPSKELYKFFDRDGNTLVLRPDITPSIARCFAKYYKNEQLPVRLCYCGNTFINYHSYQGKLKETTQLGVELMNDATTDADAEIIALTIECLSACGLSEFQVEIGHADFYNGLVEEAGFSEDEIHALRRLMDSKNIFGVEEMIDGKQIPSELKELMKRLPDLFGTAEILEYAKVRTKNERALAALQRLEKLYDILKTYGLEKYVTFDLGQTSRYRYYTGIIFKGYTYGNGEPVVSGGRYDALLKQFHKDAPAVGMVIFLDQLQLTLERQNRLTEKKKNIMLLYHSEFRNPAIRLASHYRREEGNLELVRKSSRWELEDYKQHAIKDNVAMIFYMENEATLRVIDLEDGTEHTQSLEKMLS